MRRATVSGHISCNKLIYFVHPYPVPGCFNIFHSPNVQKYYDGSYEQKAAERTDFKWKVCSVCCVDDLSRICSKEFHPSPCNAHPFQESIPQPTLTDVVSHFLISLRMPCSLPRSCQHQMSGPLAPSPLTFTNTYAWTHGGNRTISRNNRQQSILLVSLSLLWALISAPIHLLSPFPPSFPSHFSAGEARLAWDWA